MTKNKRLIEIKKELRRVKKKMQKRIYYLNKDNIDTYPFECIEDYCFPKNISAYNIITNNGTKYIISNITGKFPDIDFKNIVYVSKFIDKVNTDKYEFYDTNNGFFNPQNRWQYEEAVEKQYNVTNTVGDYED